MQSKDEHDRIVSSGILEDLTSVKGMDDLRHKMQAAEEKGAVSHTIGKLPKAGENVEINGISYRVEFADFVKGKFRIKLVIRDR